MALGLSTACTTKAPSDPQSGAARLGEPAPVEAPPPESKEPATSTPRPGEEFEVALGQRVPLSASVDITFTGNSHKISEPGFDSPLGVSFTVHHDGRDEAWYGWIDTSRPVFTVAGTELEMVDCRYDKWIRLRIK